MSNNSTFLWWGRAVRGQRHQHPGLERRLQRAGAPAGQDPPGGCAPGAAAAGAAVSRLCARLRLPLGLPGVRRGAHGHRGLVLVQRGRGRSVATVAELCFAAQWALLMHAGSRSAGGVRWACVAQAVLPMIVLAEICSWHAVLTTSNLGP